MEGQLDQNIEPKEQAYTLTTGEGSMLAGCIPAKEISLIDRGLAYARILVDSDNEAYQFTVYDRSTDKVLFMQNDKNMTGSPLTKEKIKILTALTSLGGQKIDSQTELIRGTPMKPDEEIH